MNKSIIRYILFLLAYLPIYIIIALKTIDDTLVDKNGDGLNLIDIVSNNKIPIVLIILTILLIVYFKIYSRIALKPKGNPIFEIIKIKEHHKEYITYLGMYILPFVALDGETTLDMIALVFMFLTVGYIYSKTNLIYTNPTLAFLGYEIYQIEDKKGNIYDCISKDNFKEGDKPR